MLAVGHTLRTKRRSGRLCTGTKVEHSFLIYVSVLRHFWRTGGGNVANRKSVGPCVRIGEANV